MASLDGTVVNVATVAIRASFGSSEADLTWNVDSYVLAFASLLMLGGNLAASFGSRKIYLIGMLAFVAASIGCALAPTQLFLIITRAFEGASAALFMPSSLALLVETFPDQAQRARMVGLWSAMVASAAALGPTVGGLLVSVFGWRSIFLINVPIVIVGVVLTARVVPAVRGNRRRVSFTSNALFLLTISAAAYALIQVRSSVSVGPVIAAIAVSLVAGIGLILQQVHTRAPVMPWRLFTRAPFALSNTIGFLYSAALFGSLYLMSLFFQGARHLDAFAAGVQLLPMTICFPLGNILYTRLHRRLGDATIMAIFLSLAGLATLLLEVTKPSTPYWYLAVVLGVANSGAGLVTASLTTATLRAAGDENANHAGAVLNTNRQLGVLVGVAIVGIILEDAGKLYGGTHAALAFVAAAYLSAGLAALVTRGVSKGAETT
jgi:MFS transporter, DHA2 family, methylenomycin A resistance protein